MRGIVHTPLPRLPIQLRLFTLDGDDYVIGVELARALGRETYNLYRSRVKNVQCRQGDHKELHIFLNSQLLRPGTRSVTFVKWSDLMEKFLPEELERLSVIPPNEHQMKKNHPPRLQISISSSSSMPSIHDLELAEKEKIAEWTLLGFALDSLIKRHERDFSNSPPTDCSFHKTQHCLLPLVQ